MDNKDLFQNEAEQAFEDILTNNKNELEVPSKECSLADLEKEIFSIVDSLPKIDRYALRKEMLGMQVTVGETPTTDEINEGLAKSQAYKSRLSQIYIMALKDSKIKKRCAELLQDAMMKISQEKSADKRMGQFALKYPIFLMQVEASNLFFEEVKQIFGNMVSISDSVSRQISALQLELQINGARRPNPHSNNTNNIAEEVSTKNKEVDWDTDF